MQRHLLHISGIIGVGIILITVFLIYTTSFKTTPGQNPLVPIPTGGSTQPTSSLPSSGQTTKPTPPPVLTIISSTPANQASNVPLATNISFTLSQSPTTDQIHADIVPSVPFTLSQTGNQYQMTLSQPLQANTTYYVFVGSQNQVTYNSFAFSTIQDSTQPFPDNHNILRSETNKNKYPDAYLMDHAPHTESAFSLTGQLVESPQEHFAFSVASPQHDSVSAREAFNTWALSLGLNQSQIDSLDITYQ